MVQSVNNSSNSNFNNELNTDALPKGLKPANIGKFPEENLTLKQIKKQSTQTEKIHKLFKEIKEHSELKEKEPKFSIKDAKKKKNKIKGGHTYPYDFNRAGKKIKGLFVNASEARLPNGVQYILAGHPHTPKLIGNFFDVLLDRHVKLIVTVNQPGEGGMCPAFWTKGELASAKMRDGWKIKRLDEKEILAESKHPSFPVDMEKKEREKEKNLDKWLPRIVKRTLVASKRDKKKEIIHLHYENWHDHKPAPSIRLLEKLLDIKEELHTNPKKPFSINCRGGIGRTGTVALSDLCRREIDRQLKEGKKLDKVKLNIPELVCKLREERPKTLSHAPQLQQVYQVTARYYDRLKKNNNK